MENGAARGEAADTPASLEVEKPAPSVKPDFEHMPRRRPSFLRPGVLSRRSRRRAR